MTSTESSAQPDGTQQEPRIFDARRGEWFWIDNAVVDDRIDLIPEGRRADALALYTILTRHADAAGRCFPKLPYLRRKMGRGEDTIRAAAKALQDAGLARPIERYRDDGGRLPNDYEVLDVRGTPPDTNGEGTRQDRGTPPTGSGRKNTHREEYQREEPSGGDVVAIGDLGKHYTTLTVDRCREVDFEPTARQKAAWGQGFREYAAPASGEPPRVEDVMAVVAKIVEAGAAGFYCSVPRAVKRLNGSGGGTRPAEPQRKGETWLEQQEREQAEREQRWATG